MSTGKIRWKTLLLCLAIPPAVGALSALLSLRGMKAYAALHHPPLSPPGWVFPVVWAVLYLLMGVSCYLVVTAQTAPRYRQGALYIYALQLAVNFFWSPIFFGTGAYRFALIWLLLLWGLVALTLRRLARVRPAAGWLLLPYLVWLTFAAYLNFGIALLN